MSKGNGLMYNPKYNAPDNYTDMDGMTKTFTHINYSRKSKKSMYIEEESAIEKHKKDREELINKILSLPASMFPKEFQDFILRGDEYEVLQWNENMVRDEGVPFNTLTSLYILTKNRIDLYSQGLLF